MSILKTYLILALSLFCIFLRCSAQEEGNPDPMAQEAAPEDDMMAADRVMAVDEGKEAFQDMVAAVNSADERVNALSDDLEKTLSKAESAPLMS